MDTVYNTSIIDKDLISKLERAFHKIDGFGSVEIYIVQNRVTQITTRNIVKTDHPVEGLNKHR